MKEMKLDKDEICQYQKNRDPYLMIDYATKIIPGVSAEGYKDLKDDEWFFKVHWENDPNMPGMLQIESLVQMSALSILTLDGNKGKVMYLLSANNLKFIKKITPNTKFDLKTTVNSYKRGIAVCEGRGFVGNQKVCQADFKLVLPDELNVYNLRKNNK